MALVCSRKDRPKRAYAISPGMGSHGEKSEVEGVRFGIFVLQEVME
jgi:hypothetical protein